MRLRAMLRGSHKGLEKALAIVRWVSNISYQYTETNSEAELSFEGPEALVRQLISLINESYGLSLKWEAIATL
jgi:hypothetical protein